MIYNFTVSLTALSIQNQIKHLHHVMTALSFGSLCSHALNRVCQPEQKRRPHEFDSSSFGLIAYSGASKC